MRPCRTNAAREGLEPLDLPVGTGYTITHAGAATTRLIADQRA
jgi:hypothetical protein